MRFEILAFAAIAATASADAASEFADVAACGTWKYETYVGKSVSAGWTIEYMNGFAVSFKDGNGNEVTDWSSYSGFDTSRCPGTEGAAYLATGAAGNEEDGAAYLATGAALAALAATLAF